MYFGDSRKVAIKSSDEYELFSVVMILDEIKVSAKVTLTFRSY